MKDKKGLEKSIYTGISAFLLMVGIITLTITTSYAYFAAQFTVINPDNSKSEFTSANIAAEYSDGNAISLTNAIPGTSSAIKTIKFTNTGNVNLAYKINWATITNTGITGLKYTITCDKTATGTGEQLAMPSIASNLITGTIAPNATNTCQLQIFYTDTDADQTNEMGKTFSATLEAVAAPTE